MMAFDRTVTIIFYSFVQTIYSLTTMPSDAYEEYNSFSGMAIIFPLLVILPTKCLSSCGPPNFSLTEPENNVLMIYEK